MEVKELLRCVAIKVTNLSCLSAEELQIHEVVFSICRGNFELLIRVEMVF